MSTPAVVMRPISAAHLLGEHSASSGPSDASGGAARGGEFGNHTGGDAADLVGGPSVNLLARPAPS